MTTTIACAKSIIDRLDLETFVRSWNTGEGYCIPSYSLFLIAFGFEPRRLDEYKAARAEAIKRGHEDIEDVLTAILEPVIVGSAMTAILDICDEWAEHFVRITPTELTDRAPFPRVESFIDWATRRRQNAPLIAGPRGEGILDQRSIEALLRRALGTTELIATARETGWIDPTA